MKSGFESMFSPCIKEPESKDRFPQKDPANQTQSSKWFSIGTMPTYPAGTYHFGASLAQGMVNRALYELYYGGNLCIGVDTASLANIVGDAIGSDLVFAALPELKDLIDPSTSVYIQLRPKQPPRLELGRVNKLDSKGNVVNDKSGNPVKVAALDMFFPNMELGIYGHVEGRFSRMVSSHISLKLPLRAAIGGPSKIDFTLKAPELTALTGQNDYQEYITGLDTSGFTSLISVLVGQLISQTGIAIPVDLKDTIESAFGNKFQLHISKLDAIEEPNNPHHDFLMVLLEMKLKPGTATPFMMTYQPDFKINELVLIKNNLISSRMN